MGRKIIDNKFNRLQINIAASVYTKNGKFITNPATGVPECDEDEDELNQFAIEFKRWPIPESQLQKGFEEMFAAVKQDLIRKGLLR